MQDPQLSVQNQWVPTSSGELYVGLDIVLLTPLFIQSLFPLFNRTVRAQPSAYSVRIFRVEIGQNSILDLFFWKAQGLVGFPAQDWLLLCWIGQGKNVFSRSGLRRKVWCFTDPFQHFASNIRVRELALTSGHTVFPVVSGTTVFLWLSIWPFTA